MAKKSRFDLWLLYDTFYCLSFWSGTFYQLKFLFVLFVLCDKFLDLVFKWCVKFLYNIFQYDIRYEFYAFDL